jgi:hypothetical protein
MKIPSNKEFSEKNRTGLSQKEGVARQKSTCYPKGKHHQQNEY